MNPSCPTHGALKIRQGKGGGYFCATKLADGSWCKFKMEPPAAVVPPVATGANNLPQTGSYGLAESRYFAALEFAGSVYRATASPEDALNLAKRVVAEWPS